jgi:PAS domain S-box-containing protein
MFRVLYVDDETGLLEIGKLFLENTGHFTVDTLPSATEALPLLGSTAYDAIISDYQMSEMDGIDFLKAVRASGSEIPFILFTGRGREEIVIQALNEGADFYLQKGGEPRAQFAELTHKIRQAVGRRRAEQALAESESRFRELTENSLDTIMLFDREFRHVYVNPNVEKQTGLPPDRFIGKTHVELGFPPDIVNLCEHALREVFESGDNLRVEFQLPSGLWIDWLLVPIHAPDGSVHQVITSGRDITDRKRTEEQIRLAEFSLEHSGIATFWLGKDARVIRANQSACDALGYTHEEFVHLHVFDFDPNYPPEQWKGIWDRIAREKNVVIESVHRRRDGTTFPVEIASTFFDYEGREIIHSFARDISDRKQAEMELRGAYEQIAASEEELRSQLAEIVATQAERARTEKNFRMLVDNMPDAVYVATADYLFVYLNKAALRLFGASSEDELLGTRTLDRIHPSLHQTILERVNTLTVDLQSVTLLEEVYLKLDGTPVDVEVSAIPFLYEGRHAVLVLARDISDRKRAELELQEAQAYFRSIFDTSLYGIARIGPDMRFVRVNDAFCTMMEYARDDLIGKMGIADLTYPDDMPESQEQMMRLIRHEQETYVVEKRYVTRTGKIFHAMVFVFAIFARDGSFVGASASIMDITRMKAADKDLRESRDMFRTFIDHSYDAVFIHDPDGSLLDVNTTMLDMYRVTRDEALGYSIADYTGPGSSMDDAATHWTEVLAGHDQLFPWQARRPRDGTLFDVEVYLTRIVIGGRPIILGNVREMTE